MKKFIFIFIIALFSFNIQAQNPRISKIVNAIELTKVETLYPNSAGGVDLCLTFKNLSSKTIKYFDFTCYTVNAVGDRVPCEIRGYNLFRGRDTGPISSGDEGGGTWGCIVYNYSAKAPILTSIKITYMDGTILSISESEIKHIFPKQSSFK